MSCCECRVVEFRGIDGPTTQVETNPNCPCESCHEPWENKLHAAVAWMHEARTTTNHHPQGV